MGRILSGEFCVFLAIFGHLLAQNIVFEEKNEEELQNSIPEELLIQLKDVRNLNDFISRFVEPQSVSSNRKKLYSPKAMNRTTVRPDSKERSDEVTFVSLIGRTNSEGTGLSLPSPNSMAEFSGCQPEPQPVQLEKQDAATFLWPPCVQVKRCRGCCTSGMLHCQPTASSSVNFTVLEVKYNPLKPSTFESQGFKVHTLVQHDRCTCGCRVLASQCSEVEEYKESECKCVCKNRKESAQCTDPKRIWDSSDCTCKCKRYRQCSSGRFFNPLSCRCEELRSSPGLSRISSNASRH